MFPAFPCSGDMFRALIFFFWSWPLLFCHCNSSETYSAPMSDFFFRSFGVKKTTTDGPKLKRLSNLDMLYTFTPYDALANATSLKNCRPANTEQEAVCGVRWHGEYGLSFINADHARCFGVRISTCSKGFCWHAKLYGQCSLNLNKRK